MATSIKAAFKEEGAHVKFDQQLAKRISRFAIGWANANDDHVAFLGGNLLGVHPIRFKQSDRNLWFDEVLEMDEYSLKEAVHSTPEINPKFLVSSDVMNLSCLWLLHEFYHTRSLSPARKEEVMIDVLLVLHYKFLSSIMAYYFRYPADREVALATYAELSKKFSLKKHGSWAALLRARAQDIISRKSIHYNTIVKFDDDSAIIDMVNDIQGRIREVVKKMMVVFYRVRDQGSKISTTQNSVRDLEGDLAVRDLVRNQTVFLRYIKSVVPNRRDFVKDEIVEIIAAAMHTMPERLLVSTLTYMSDCYSRLQTREIDPILEDVLHHAFDYLESSGSGLTRLGDLATIIARLRALYTASRSSDPVVLRLRANTEKLVRKATRQTNSSVVASVRTGVLLYIVVRTLTMHRYTK